MPRKKKTYSGEVMPALRDSDSPVPLAHKIIMRFHTRREQIEEAMLNVDERHVPFVVHVIERFWASYKVNALRAVAELLVLPSDNDRKAHIRKVPPALREDVRAIYKVERKHWNEMGGCVGLPPHHILTMMIERRGMK